MATTCDWQVFAAHPLRPGGFMMIVGQAELQEAT
jgi:hypothetical protein